jgi:ACS family hexuronate transporter-like MFS transporter
MMFASIISYIDRNALAVLAPTVLKDLGLTAQQYGFAISAFSIAYMIANPIWGHVLDRWGLYRGMLAAVALWTAASASHAIVTGLITLAAARMILGLAEGAIFPGGLKSTADCLAERHRGRGTAVAYSGGAAGAILTPLIVVPIALAFTWRAAFLFTGLAGCLWLLAWAAADRITSPLMRRTAATSVRTLPRFSDARLWNIVFGYGLGALPLAFCLYAAPLFLSRAMGLSQASLGKLLWLPAAGWEVGYFFWGWIVDRIPPVRSRFAPLMVGLALCSLPLAALWKTQSVGVVMAGFVFAMFVAAGFIILCIRFGAAAYDKEQAGLVGGIAAGSWSFFVAILMPIVGHYFDAGRYPVGFMIAGTIPLVGTAGWLLSSR